MCTIHPPGLPFASSQLLAYEVVMLERNQAGLPREFGMLFSAGRSGRGGRLDVAISLSRATRISGILPFALRYAS